MANRPGPSFVDNVLNWFDNGTRGYSSMDAKGNWYNTKEGYQNAAKYKPPAAKKSTPTYKSSYDSRAHDRYMAGINAEIAALQAQVAATPNLIAYDVLGNYNKAKKQAQKNQKRYYDKIWKNKVNEWNAATRGKRGSRDLGYEQNRMANRYTKEDNATNRARTAEDVASAIQEINTGELNFQTDEGTQFDVDRRALQEGVAASGLTTSGLGQSQIGVQQDQRNIASERQVVEFDNQRAAKELFKNRTFADLARGDLRADEKKKIEDKSVKLDFDTYMNQLAAEKKSARLNWEVDYMGAVTAETDRLTKERTQQFINSLAGQGYNARDIAYTADFYK